jgi:hypothetical protein
VAQVYVSSTFEDLAEHRQAVLDVIRRMRHDEVAM